MNYEISPPRVALALLLAATLFALLTAGGATAVAASNCGGLPDYPSSKGGYFQTLQVTQISCKTGKSLMRSHYTCRVKHGLKGHCTSVRGYRCTEKRGLAIPTEYSGRVTCKAGSKRFVYTYQQNL
jgi:hypothetical protein